MSGTTVKVTGSVLIACGVLSLGPSARAQTGDEDVAGVQMFLSGIDAQQAARAGNTVRFDGHDKVLSDGRTGRELARTPADPQAGVTWAFEQSEVTAWKGHAPRALATRWTCGSASIAIRDVPQKDLYQFKTGFTVEGRAAYFRWRIEIEAARMRRYTYSQEFSGPLSPRRTWTSDWRPDYSEITRYLSTQENLKVRHFARITLAEVLLYDGRICMGGHPVASAWVR
ncbi:hypothetical protein [Pyxidicoccus caerfyrddinensis]|uniref:hypothetical protein n=1 Tax=Pyxidicoccus caerfyrddinensis TaxID=2709663 RepID=UPI0013DA8FF5|nr:hypothetical protein [Pyxidicoccus caerfyrddinensis]